MAQDGRRWSIRALGLSAQVVEGLVNIKRENQSRHRRGGGWGEGRRVVCLLFIRFLPCPLCHMTRWWCLCRLLVNLLLGGGVSSYFSFLFFLFLSFWEGFKLIYFRLCAVLMLGGVGNETPLDDSGNEKWRQSDFSEGGGGQKRAREKIIKMSPKVNMWSGFSLPDVGDMFRFLLLWPPPPIRRH